MANNGTKNSAASVKDKLTRRQPDLDLDFQPGDTITQKWYRLSEYFIDLVSAEELTLRKQEARVADAPRINQTFLVHLLMLSHTTQYFLDLSLEYERGDLQLNDLRVDAYLGYMVDDDRHIGEHVELLAYTREETMPLMTDVGHDRPRRVPRDSRGRAIAKHHFVNLPGNHPINVVRPLRNKQINMETTPKVTDEAVDMETTHQTTEEVFNMEATHQAMDEIVDMETTHQATDEAVNMETTPQVTDEVVDKETTPERPVVTFPEYGYPVIYARHIGRWVCSKHHRGICRKCKIDFAGVALLEGQDPTTVINGETTQEADEYGWPYAVFERYATQRFAAREYADRLEAYPDETYHDPFLNISYNPYDRFSVERCEFGNSIRYVPQWDHAVVKWDEANLSKLRCNGVVPNKLVPLRDVFKYSCEDCQVTWQLPREENFHVLMRHPSHHTKVGGSETGASRSMIVHVKGAFVQGNSATETPPRASIGVFFGPDSQYNVMAPFRRSILSEAFDDDRNGGHPGVVMNQTTPVFAAVVWALKQIRWDFLADRSDLVEKWGRYNSNGAVLNAQRFRVILVTDSKELVDSLSAIPNPYKPTFLRGDLYPFAKNAARMKEKAKKKREKGKATAGAAMKVEGHVDWEDFTYQQAVTNPKRVILSKITGALIANCDGMLAVMRETTLLNILGVSVVYYLQPSNVNLAEPLAKAAWNYELQSELGEEALGEEALGETVLVKRTKSEEGLSEKALVKRTKSEEGLSEKALGKRPMRD